ncbi:MAG: protein jag [Clostridia bacterium]|nr:protein jag [Clostridia bacterium]
MEDNEIMCIESTGKSVDEAIFKGLQQMGISIDEVSIEILRTETKGILGIGAKPAVVKLTKKPDDELLDVFGRDEKPARNEDRPRNERREDNDRRDRKNRHDRRDNAEQERAKKPEQAKKNAEERKPRPEKKEEANANISRENMTEKKPEPSVKEAADKPEAVKTLNYTEEAAEGNPAAEFVKGLIKRMGAEGRVLAAMDEDCLRLRIDSEKMGMLIGHRGETLDAMQYLTGLVVNKNRKTDGYTRVTLNTEEYREKREETLRRLAKKVAAQVRATGRPRVLEPMNPYERRVLHATLQNNPDVTTHSEGEEPNRRVVVTPKRRGRSGYTKNRNSRRPSERRPAQVREDDSDNGTISREEYERLYAAARAANPMFMNTPKKEEE